MSLKDTGDPFILLLDKRAQEMLNNLGGYNESLPPACHSELIESVWRLEAGYNSIVPPDGTYNLIFSRSVIKISGNLDQTLDAGFHMISPMKNSIFISSEESIVGLRVKLFSFSASKNAELIGSQGIQGVSSKTLKCIQKKELTLQEKYELLFNELCDFFEIDSDLLLKKRDFINYILIRKGRVKISTMADDFGCSRQNLNQFFKRQFGVGAKQLALRWQLSFFLSKAYETGEVLDSLFEAGYYDQAHCINTCKNLYSLSPDRILKEEQLMAHTLVSSRNRFSNVYSPRH